MLSIHLGYPSEEEEQAILHRFKMAPPGIVVPFASERGHDERLLATFARLVPAVSVSMAAIIERERALFSPGTQVILVGTEKVLTQATLERLLEIREHGSHLQVVVTGDQAQARRTDLSDLPIHSLGGREQWHALIQSFVQEKSGLSEAGSARL